jgi:hypothetical protein
LVPWPAPISTAKPCLVIGPWKSWACCDNSLRRPAKNWPRITRIKAKPFRRR